MDLSLTVPTRVDFLLQPWGWYRFNSTAKRRELLQIKPKVKGSKKKRVCKDLVYMRGIRELCDREGIRGDYLGLAAAHGAEIYTCLSDFIEYAFITCQHELKDYILIKEYMRKVQLSYRNEKVRFEAVHADILDALLLLPKSEKFAIGDLDLMCPLTQELADRVSEGWALRARKKSVLALWHTSNREKGGGDKLIDKKYRPYLEEQLRKYFDILEWNRWSYYEPQRTDGHAGFPMRIEIVALEKKCEKALRAA